MKSIILIAAPAAGKGTEANKLKNEYHIPQISTGDLLRDSMKKNNEISKKINECVSTGKLVSDEIVINLLKARLKQQDCDNGYILDGFPRNISQAMEYQTILSDLKKDLGMVIVLDVDKEKAKKRIIGRMSCPNCGAVYNTNLEKTSPKEKNICDICKKTLIKRSDDDINLYDERYHEYIQKTSPLIDYYTKLNVVYHVDANISPEYTHNQVKKIIEGANND